MVFSYIKEIVWNPFDLFHVYINENNFLMGSKQKNASKYIIFPLPNIRIFSMLAKNIRINSQLMGFKTEKKILFRTSFLCPFGMNIR